jgi:hypothetical protein
MQRIKHEPLRLLLVSFCVAPWGLNQPRPTGSWQRRCRAVRPPQLMRPWPQVSRMIVNEQSCEVDAAVISNTHWTAHQRVTCCWFCDAGQSAMGLTDTQATHMSPLDPELIERAQVHARTFSFCRLYRRQACVRSLHRPTAPPTVPNFSNPALGSCNM